MTQFNTNIYDGNAISFKTFLSRVFSTMAVGLLISGIIAFFVNVNFYSIVISIGLETFSTLLLVAVIAELIVGILFSSRLMKMSKTSAWICYVVYSSLTGLSLALIVQSYTVGTVLFAFASTVILFVCMSIIGHTTNVDLTRFGSMLMVGLISIIITGILNSLFFKSEMINYIMSVVGVVIFLVLIAYDMQKLRNFYYQGTMDNDFQEKMVLYGAFSLYLDFINLFIRLLQIFGRRSGSDRN